ncbi:SH3-domain kinase binding protein 1, isoform CRA_g [Rattus norvegicus]|uniref:SH3-domain kinase binding protein 1, isoform CRA_g n=1 Tax=Rattus norvegicus TaxID=10116 RepID=A6IPM8_RAT|nr:SH3-domain kinase binding protein 1, isoform CRA_g [Rattus norvegicus]
MGEEVSSGGKNISTEQASCGASQPRGSQTLWSFPLEWRNYNWEEVTSSYINPSCHRGAQDASP